MKRLKLREVNVAIGEPKALRGAQRDMEPGGSELWVRSGSRFGSDHSKSCSLYTWFFSSVSVGANIAFYPQG